MANIKFATDHSEVSDEVFLQLKTAALEARSKAYCPYSKFRVGCALLTESGEFVPGANVENASYGGAICAERSAITRAVVDGHRKFKVIAISADTPDPISPCGICRQFIREFGAKIPIYMFNTNGDKFYKSNIDELLPYGFGPESLPEN
jgi:cytidine deaminase